MIMICFLCFILGLVIGYLSRFINVKAWIRKRFPWDPPQYARIGSTALQLERHVDGDDTVRYYRDAGAWSIEARREWGKWVVIEYAPGTHFDHLSGARLYPISYREWVKDNVGYV